MTAFHPLLKFKLGHYPQSVVSLIHSAAAHRSGRPSARSECGKGCGSSRRCLWRENEPHPCTRLELASPRRPKPRKRSALARRHPASARQLRDAGRRDKDQAQVQRFPMHLKCYLIDGRLLRTGAANFSASGLKRQDNDLIVIESAGAAASFKRNFDARFASGEALSAGAR